MSLWSDLGLPEPDLRGGGPEVDVKIILSLIRQELPHQVVRTVWRNIMSWKAWHTAHSRVLLAEFRWTRVATVKSRRRRPSGPA